MKIEINFVDAKWDAQRVVSLDRFFGGATNDLIEKARRAMPGAKAVTIKFNGEAVGGFVKNS